MKRVTIQSALALIVVIGYILFVIVTGDDNETFKNILILVIGYYFGSSSGSAKKTDMMNKNGEL